jgi:stalled ribosome alternative rescue factor ArfA
MKVRRTHSSIDKLPAGLQKALEAMLVDNVWPDDFEGKKTGKPQYKNLEKYCRQKGFEVSKSAIGRFGLRMRTLAKMKEAGLIVRSVMDGLDAENASQTQKAVAELLTARAIELAAEKNLNPKQLRDMSTAMRDCAGVSIKADQYRQQQLKQNATKVAANTKDKLTKANVDRKLIQEIIDEQLGVVK